MKTSRSARLQIEQLEDRLVPTASIVNHVLVVQGTAGNDTIIVSDSKLAGPARVVATTGLTTSGLSNSFLFLRSSFDSIQIKGLAGNDILRNATNIPARIEGSAGDDQLQGGPGDDTLVGGLDNDTYRFGAGLLGHDTIDEAGISPIGQGTVKGDTLDFSLVNPAILTMNTPNGDVLLPTTSQGVRIDMKRSDTQNVLDGRLQLTLLQPSSIENVTGSPFNDIIKGNDTGNQLLGGAGNDEIWGRGGNDLVSGGTGKDILLGADPDHLDNEFDRFADVFDLAHPVIDGTSYLDVVQAHSQSSSILSTLAAAANQGIDFAGNIHVLANNQFAVRLHRSGYVDTVTVKFDGTWTSNDAQPTRERDASGQPVGAITGEFWALLYQRAYLQRYIANSQNADITTWNRAGNFAWEDSAHALAVFTGRTVSPTAIAPDEPTTTADMLWTRLAAGDIVTAKLGDQTYAVLGVFVGPWRSWCVSLYNPNARDDDFDMVMGTNAQNDGFMALGWSEFANLFDTVLIAQHP